MASIAPPPPPPPGNKIAKTATMTASRSASHPFSVNGSMKEDQVFEFHDVQDGAGSIFLQPIIRHYLGVPRYWKQRTLNLLSGFGFRISRTEQVIQIPGLEEIIQTLEHTFQDQVQEARDTIKRGFITFEALGELYRPEAPVQAMMGSGNTAAVFLVSEAFYQENRGLTGV
ncbi:hypothetical protein EJ07DRAFT_159921 [Lizonia empirigonia]|nr:hypothetical protein EJ07DRAFT_159921 [Lizonia empirigonia]